MFLQKKNWKEIRKWLHKNNLDKDENVWLIDIDDTLIKCSSYIGSSAWFDKEIKKNKTPEMVIFGWVEMIPFLNFELCCDWLPSFINSLRGEVIAVTARHCAAQKYSHKHLENNGFDNISTIISCGNIPKECMVTYYIQPNRLKTYIFVDDKKKNVLKMHKQFPNMICIWINEQISWRSKLYFNLFGT
tara:strand:+ start:5098 stop:5661 length:564 start_codon:yes stop_codon:yes gene_type:complete